MNDMMLHQQGDVQWAHKVQKGLLGNEPGLGKSRSAIEATKGLRTLVVAPAMVINSGTWADELAKWADDPDLYTVVPYTQLNPRRAEEREVEGGGTKKVSLVERRKVRPELKGPWEAVIADESHYIKGRDTSWTYALHKIAKTADIVLPMTGTPIPNWSHELFTTLQLINPDEAGRGGRLGSFWRWAEDWFDCSPTRHSAGRPVAGAMLACTPSCYRLPTSEICEHYLDFARVNLGEQYRRIWRKDVLDLPPMTETWVQTPMSEADRRAYNRFKRDFVAQVDGQTIIAWTQGTMNVMLDHLTISPWFLTKKGPPHGGKLDQLALDLSGRSRATLVIAHYKDVVEACHEVARGVGLRSAYIHGGVSSRAAAQAFADFKSGKLDVLVGSLETIAEGHTLTVADMAIFVERSWKVYRNEQALYRIYRIGQDRPVTVRQYLTPRSLDTSKMDVIKAKTEHQIRTMTAAEFAALL
jgi:hypothetical protein